MTLVHTLITLIALCSPPTFEKHELTSFLQSQQIDLRKGYWGMTVAVDRDLMAMGFSAQSGCGMVVVLKREGKDGIRPPFFILQTKWL